MARNEAAALAALAAGQQGAPPPAKAKVAPMKGKAPGKGKKKKKKAKEAVPDFAAGRRTFGGKSYPQFAGGNGAPGLGGSGAPAADPDAEEDDMAGQA